MPGNTPGVTQRSGSSTPDWRGVGDLTFKPRLYYNHWTHYHPVTGAINDNEEGTDVFGTDLSSTTNTSCWARARWWPA